MREIKFRGLRTDGKGWVYGYYYEYSGKHIICWQNHSDNVTKDYFSEVIPESVGQFTGHNDKNGVQIYEGDIISNYWGKRVVEYTPGDGIKLAIIYDEPLNGIHQTHEDFRYNSTSISSVIGSIHTTPELLNPSNN